MKNQLDRFPLSLLPKTVFTIFPLLSLFAFLIFASINMLAVPQARGIKIALLVIGVVGFALCVWKIYIIRKLVRRGEL